MSLDDAGRAGLCGHVEHFMVLLVWEVADALSSLLVWCDSDLVCGISVIHQQKQVMSLKVRSSLNGCMIWVLVAMALVLVIVKMIAFKQITDQ